jgi:hypothetical protein
MAYYGEMAANVVNVEDFLTNDFFTVAQNITINATRIGNKATLTWDLVSGTNAVAQVAICPSALDADYRPNDNVTGACLIDVGGTVKFGRIIIRTNGNIEFYDGPSASFPGSGSVSIFAGSFSYIV